MICTYAYNIVLLHVRVCSIAESITVRVMAHRENNDTEPAVSSTECMVCAYYSGTSDVPGSVQQTVRLPLTLAYEVHSTPYLDFNWSAKISVDESPVPLKTLFKGEERALHCTVFTYDDKNSNNILLDVFGRIAV